MLALTLPNIEFSRTTIHWFMFFGMLSIGAIILRILIVTYQMLIKYI